MHVQDIEEPVANAPLVSGGELPGRLHRIFCIGAWVHGDLYFQETNRGRGQ